MAIRQRISTIGTIFEDEARAAGYTAITGLDEVGRGALAGPVVAAAVIIDPLRALPEGLDDSKKLDRTERERIAGELRDTVIAYAVGQIEADEIDRINILQATFRAMLCALQNLSTKADYLLIDAVKLKDCELPQKSIIKGDAISASIAAASVIAKVFRDGLMREHHKTWPNYKFDSHVGYGTRAHWQALREHGACPLHRKTFKGVLDPWDLFSAAEGSEAELI